MLFPAEFCLLEQILPDTSSHPFAVTMLAHFEKLSTPIKSVKQYPTIFQQVSRFRDSGWSRVQAQSLWSAWGDELFLTAEERRALDLVEPFDEHEEFALFADHYMILHAKNYGNSSTLSAETASRIPCTDVETTCKKLTGQHALRRFVSPLHLALPRKDFCLFLIQGAAMTTTDAFGNEVVFNCLGLVNNNRLSSYDVFTREGLPCNKYIPPRGGPSARTCFQMTDLGHLGVLLTGGRASPAKGMADCWLLKKDSLAWERTFDMPVPLYRHSACRLTGSSLVLVVGGRSGATGISDLIAVYHPEKGWQKCSIAGSTQSKVVFGATLTCSGRGGGLNTVFHGFLAGGLSSAGVIDRTLLAWSLSFDDEQVSSLYKNKFYLNHGIPLKGQDPRHQSQRSVCTRKRDCSASLEIWSHACPGS